MLTEVCTDIIDIPSINVKSKNNYKTLIKGNRQQSNSKWKAKVDNYKNLRELLTQLLKLSCIRSRKWSRQIEESVTRMKRMSYKYANLNDQAQFRLVLHNIEGLNGYYMETKNHSWLDKCDIVCLTETWLTTGKNAPEINSHIDTGFNRCYAYEDLSLPKHKKNHEADAASRLKGAFI
ncbi:unnamed protein product [Didymodactylos carnosus]|uniref:Uncharacterized protein n=1 Tax=Didymodactylos carnosus TaxID=1234261 RepID=A0A8S2RIK2_9BILA|nr:unnamed protein product [Didymodactylos carnosus]CAF4153263.1 unnamed protein product [Didymodactylos carnosus]